MIEALKPYVEYKESGVPWLGKMPMHWRLERLGTIGRFSASGIDKKTMPGEPKVRMINYLDIYKNPSHELRANRQLMVVSCPEVKKHDHAAKQGDIFFTPSSETSDDIGWSAVAMEDLQDTVYSYHVIRFRSHESIDLLYLRYWCNNTFVLNQFSRASRGTTRKILDRCDFRRIIVVLPPGNEQATIGRFLDWANNRLEQAIRTKKKLIVLLNEQKQAIIHRAVTRGLDPNVRLKPSGIEWLGDVPEHWEVKRSKYVFREVDARSTNGEETKLSMSQKLGLVRSSLIEERRLVSESFVGAKICEPGDIVLNRLKAHLGVFALASEHGLVSPDYTVFRAIRPICGKYFELAYRTPACRVELRKRAKGIVQGFWRLYSDDFYQIVVPIPPLDEQNRIIAQLDTDLATLNHTITDTHREIDLLREYRTRLISDVVTGKLDVRGVKLPAMDETEVLEEIEISEETEAEELIESEEVTDADN